MHDLTFSHHTHTATSTIANNIRRWAGNGQVQIHSDSSWRTIRWNLRVAQCIRWCVCRPGNSYRDPGRRCKVIQAAPNTWKATRKCCIVANNHDDDQICKSTSFKINRFYTHYALINSLFGIWLWMKWFSQVLFEALTKCNFLSIKSLEGLELQATSIL